MEMKIKTDSGEQLVVLKNPKGRHTKKAFKLLTKIVNESGSEDLGALDKYMDYLDEMTAELTGMTVEALDDLDTDEKNKLVAHYQEKVQNKFDFLKSSLNPQSSVPRAKKE